MFPAALVGDRLKGTIFALDAGCPLVAEDGRSVTLQSFYVGAQSLHHLHGLDVVNRIDSDRQLRYVKGPVISGSGDLSSITISEVLRSNTIKRATCFGRVRLHLRLVPGFLLSTCICDA